MCLIVRGRIRWYGGRRVSWYSFFIFKFFVRFYNIFALFLPLPSVVRFVIYYRIVRTINKRVVYEAYNIRHIIIIMSSCRVWNFVGRSCRRYPAEFARVRGVLPGWRLRRWQRRDDNIHGDSAGTTVVPSSTLISLCGARARALVNFAVVWTTVGGGSGSGNNSSSGGSRRYPLFKLHKFALVSYKVGVVVVTRFYIYPSKVEYPSVFVFPTLINITIDFCAGVC